VVIAECLSRAEARIEAYGKGLNLSIATFSPVMEERLSDLVFRSVRQLEQLIVA